MAGNIKSLPCHFHALKPLSQAGLQTANVNIHTFFFTFLLRVLEDSYCCLIIASVMFWYK